MSAPTIVLDLDTLRTFTGRAVLPEPKSNGFQASFKTEHDGDRYQVQASAWLIGSKTSGEEPTGDPAEVAAKLEIMARDLRAKTFESGKSGFYAQSKLEIDGQRYQAAVQAVRIG